MMTDCNRIRDRLDEYLLGGLELPGRAMVAMHVAHCYECREELRDLETLLNELVPTLRHPLPVDRFGELMAAIEEDRRRARTSALGAAWRRRATHRALAVAAAVALFVVAGPWISMLASEPFVDRAKRAEAAVQPLPASADGIGQILERRDELEKFLSEEPLKAPVAPEEEASKPERVGQAVPKSGAPPEPVVG